MVSVWDVANFCIACLESEDIQNGGYIASSEELVSYDRLVEVFESITSRTLDVRRQPFSLIKVQNIPLPFPLTEHLVYSGALLAKTLDYRYMTLVEGMSKTYDWFLSSKP